MFDLITIGDSTLDTFIIMDENTSGCFLDMKASILSLNFAEKIPITHTKQSVGGNAANVAVGSVRLGLKSTIVTELGEDLTGFAVKHELEDAGVNTRLVKIRNNKQTRFSVILNFKSERTILSAYSERRYTLPKLPRSKWIYYTSLGKSFGNLQTKLQKQLKLRKTKLAVNPGSYQIKNGLVTFKKILKDTDYLQVNLEEAVMLVGRKKKVGLLCKDLLKMGVKLVVITDSTNGSWATDGKEQYFMPVYPIKPVAKTGAGDAYASGFLSALIHGKEIPEAMRWGTANAGSVIQQFGAQKGLVTITGINKIIKKYKKITPQIV